MTKHQFEFTGKAGEYFGIWIVNLFLSIITLGIYTAWAKVRRLRYFYANTHLDGHNFEYHAKPKSILIGRIIVIGFLILYNGLISLTPLAAILIIPYLIAFPWIINKAIGFNARVTSYRNVRFNFQGTYWRSMLVFVVMPIAALFTGGILAPVVSRMSNNYIGSNLRYGTAKFSTDAPLGALYGNWGASIVFTLIATLAVALIGAGVVFFGGDLGLSRLMSQLPEIKPDQEFAFIIAIIAVAGFYIAAILAFLFYRAGVRNIAYKATILEGGHILNSTISRTRYVWILVSNLFASIVTLGLLRPWAAIRSWRYYAANTSLMATGDLGNFAEQRQPEGAAAGAEFLDIEGIDFGL